MYMYVFIHIYMCILVCMYTCICMCVYIVPKASLYMYMCIHVHTYTQLCMYIVHIVMIIVSYRIVNVNVINWLVNTKDDK